MIGIAIVFCLTITIHSAVIVDGRIYFTLFGDAMISMRYAKTPAAGGGLTWNPGDMPVEGFTNLLWTLWMALLHLAPVEEGWVPLLSGRARLSNGLAQGCLRAHSFAADAATRSRVAMAVDALRHRLGRPLYSLAPLRE